MTAGTYTGTTIRTYTQYLDMGAGGHTLVAHPQATYGDIEVAQGWTGLSALPADGYWGTSAPLTFTSTPGLAVIGALSIGFTGFSTGYRSVFMPGADLTAPAETPPVAAEAEPEDVTWARGVVEAAVTGEAPVFAEIRARLKRMDADVTALRRKPGGPASGR